jgi:hypothetical protein
MRLKFNSRTNKAIIPKGFKLVLGLAQLGEWVWMASEEKFIRASNRDWCVGLETVLRKIEERRGRK